MAPRIERDVTPCSTEMTDDDRVRFHALSKTLWPTATAEDATILLDVLGPDWWVLCDAVDV